MNESSDHTTAAESRYLVPDWFTKRVFNPTMRWLVRRGVDVLNTRELRVVGRKSRQVRTTVVHVLELDGQRYLIAPRGTTEWVRNLRAAGGVGEIRLGRRSETFQATELPDDRKGPILRAYVTRWGWEVGRFFEGVTKRSTDDELAAIAPGFPVWVIAADQAGVDDE